MLEAQFTNAYHQTTVFIRRLTRALARQFVMIVAQSLFKKLNVYLSQESAKAWLADIVKKTAYPNIFGLLTSRVRLTKQRPGTMVITAIAWMKHRKKLCVNWC